MTSTTTTPALAPRRFALSADRRFWIIVSLLTLYLVWGTTYLVIRFALAGFTPYWMMALRFVIAGGALLIFLMLRGAALPTLRQWRSATLVGALLMGGGMGTVALVEESVSSGLVATMAATVPLWTMIFAMLWRRFPARREWIGVGLGLLGVVLLSREGDLLANPAALALMIFAPACWGLGSAWIKHLDLPQGAMSSAAQMLAGGLVLCAMALLRGEAFPSAPTPGSLLALLYLITLGSLATMTAYTYLLRTVSPALATSYAFVNPAIALLLGVVLGGEVLTGSALIALPVILIGVGFVFYARKDARH